jgi:hypothetical protein
MGSLQFELIPTALDFTLDHETVSIVITVPVVRLIVEH